MKAHQLDSFIGIDALLDRTKHSLKDLVVQFAQLNQTTISYKTI
jgi:hypothetical protein